MKYGLWDINRSAKKLEKIKIRYEKTLDKQINDLTTELPTLEKKYNEYLQGVKFVDYFED